jgi:hypothetical protein
MPRIFPIISPQDFERYQKALLGDGIMFTVYRMFIYTIYRINNII